MVNGCWNVLQNGNGSGTDVTCEECSKSKKEKNDLRVKLDEVSLYDLRVKLDEVSSSLYDHRKQFAVDCLSIVFT